MASLNAESNHSQQSQSSSNDSTVSRLSSQNNITKDDLPPTSSRDEQARETTPSTSLSDASSQEPSVINRSPALSPGFDSTSPRSIHSPAPQPTNGKNHLQRLNHAPKRTASGEIKRVAQNQQSTPQATSPSSHSRHTSTTSKSSYISDMSNDLCTRLSYAMFKVQNGFQSHSLDEIEAMARQKTISSPTATTPQRRTALYSPSSTFRASESPYELGKRGSMQYPSTDAGRLAHQPQQQDGSLRSPRSQSSGLVRTSWHSDPTTAGSLDNSPPQQSPHRGPTLAPPADIHPRNPRRPQSNGAQQSQQDARNINRYPFTKTPTTPSTPPLNPTPNNNIRTPTAPTTTKSAEEQDAVETLMFMSSPGPRNPTYQTTTTVFPTHTHAHIPFSPPTTNSARFKADPRYVSPAPLSTTAEIDRVLDQMPIDEHSSSDEDGGFV
ncbi:MAG: hypothetical protein Q9169_004126 [Polycauliona sp. 2 TL-2023]